MSSSCSSHALHPRRSFARHLLSLFAIVSLGTSAGCRRPPDATPEGAVDELLRACEESAHDPEARARAFALLAPSSRRALEERARRATALTGKPVTADQMLVPAWTPLQFEVSRTTTTLAPDGTHATVDVYGPDPKAQHAAIPLEREGESFRIILAIPPSP